MHSPSAALIEELRSFFFAKLSKSRSRRSSFATFPSSRSSSELRAKLELPGETIPSVIYMFRNLLSRAESSILASSVKPVSMFGFTKV